FFQRFIDPDAPPGLTHDGQSLWPGLGSELSAVMHSLAALERGGKLEVNPAVFERPETAAVLADILLARSPKGDPAPLHVLEKALARLPKDLRLRQLMGLYLSREGRPEEAINDWLEPLLEKHDQDEETVGIIAGACKKLWRQGPTKKEHLERSHRGYRDG